MSELEVFLKSEKKIFMDTSSLLHRSVDKYWMKAVPLIERYENSIIVPYKCYEEIEKHANSSRKPELQVMARKQLKNVTALCNKQDIKIRGDKGESFADSVFHTVFEKFRVRFELVLITQDRNLAKEILKKNESKSVIGKKIIVRRLNSEGELVEFDFERRGDVADDTMDKKNVDAFNLCSSVANVPNRDLKVRYIPCEKSIVYDVNRHSYVLNKELGRGGEGVIYDVGSGLVAKIYHEGKHNTYRQKKLELMVSRKIICPGICYPREILYNREREFVGYLMPVSKGKNLQHTVFGKPFIVKNFPEWEKIDLVKLCLTILEKVDYLHKYNILLGDINPFNILVVSSTEVYFVDTDSYQVEGFPCPVGTVPFSAPEIQHKDCNTFMRSKQNENFAIAVLLFMILHCGKHPYSQLGGESMDDNIMQMEFPYPYGEKSNKKAPTGAYRYMWSHLDLSLKRLFYETFQKGEAQSTPDKRPSVRKWIGALNRYKTRLENGEIEKFDTMSIDLFPTRFKRANENQVFVICKKCGKEFDTEFDRGKGLCKDCFYEEKNKVVYSVKCQNCGTQIQLNQGEYDYYMNRGLHLPVRCSNCKNKRKKEMEYKNKTYTLCYCKDCGRQFTITNGEYDFYRNKGFDLPTRCSSCRGKNNGTSSGAGNGSSSIFGKIFDWF